MVALVCVLLHIPLVWMHWAEFPGTSLIMLGVAAACVPCALHLWRRPTQQAWARAGALAGAILTLHLMMVFMMLTARTNEVDSTKHGFHHHGTVPTVLSAPGPVHEHAGMSIFYVASGLAVFQILLAVAMVISPQQSDTPVSSIDLPAKQSHVGT